MSLATELEARGFIQQHSAATLPEILDGEKRTIYHGIDPTADSAHAGNFVIWMLLRRLAAAGHKIIFLVGGGTGMIGDPKSDIERPTSDPEAIAQNVGKIKAQAEHLFAGSDISFVNNADWLIELNLINFLRDIGKNFTVNELIKKEAISARLGSENGISYTEFAYPLLQAYDYLVLNKEYGCEVQVGGSDQWGNIIAGVDLIRRKQQKTAYALTVPIIVDKATGKKFGKSEGNAVWLAAEKTSPYKFYQFWLNTSDESVIEYLKLFTDLSLEEISEVEKIFEKNPGDRDAQKILAKSVTEIVHGEQVAEQVANVSEILFGEGEIGDLSPEEIDILLHNAPMTEVTAGDAVLDVLLSSSLATSKREARMFIESGAISLNDIKIENIDRVLAESDFSHSISLLRRGKKQFSVLHLK